MVAIWNENDETMSNVSCVFEICNDIFVKLPPCFWQKSEMISDLRPVNERRRYFVTTSLIGWAQAYNHPEGLVSVPGPRLNIKTVLSTYGDFHVKDKTAVRTSYL